MIKAVVRALAVWCGLVGALCAADAWKVGDKVEAWNTAWYPAEIIAVGVGEHAGQFMVHYEGFSTASDRWLLAKNIRARTKAGDSNSAEASAKTWKVGDKVEAWNSAWYPAEIIAVGTEAHAGQFRVHYEKFSAASDQWILAKNIRARAKVETSKSGEASAGPRAGRYRIYSYGAPPSHIYLGDVDLEAGGNYRALQPGGKLLGEGQYRFDAASSTVIWLSGPYHSSEWGGAFEVSREGKTHTIRLRRSTIATNSVD